QLTLHFVEAAVLVAPSSFPAGAEAGGVVLELVPALVIGLAHVVRTPVRLFDRRVDQLGDALPGHRARIWLGVATGPPPVSAGRDHRRVMGNTTLGEWCH